jgi:hypothetical protein
MDSRKPSDKPTQSNMDVSKYVAAWNKAFPSASSDEYKTSWDMLPNINASKYTTACKAAFGLTQPATLDENIELAIQERLCIREMTTQYASIRQSKLELLEMEEELCHSKFALQYAKLRRATVAALAKKDERLCQAKLTSLILDERLCHLKFTAQYTNLRQKTLAAIDAEEKLQRLTLTSQYEKLRRAKQAATPSVLSQSYENVRGLVPKPIRSAVPAFSSALGMVDDKMTKTINNELLNLSDNWNKEPLSNKQRVSNALGNMSMPLAYHATRALLDPSRREEFSSNSYDYDKLYEALSPETKEYLINLDRFKNEPSLSDKYQKMASEEPSGLTHPNRRIMGQKIPNFKFNIPLKKF